MPRYLASIPKIAVTALMIFAIANLLIGVFLRYVVGNITDYFDLDPVPFTWVEEVGEMALAWLTLVGAAIGIYQRSHFTLHVFVHNLSPAAQRVISQFNHVLIGVIGGLTAVYGYKLCILNAATRTPGLELGLIWLYGSAVVGGILMVVYAIAMIIAPPPEGDGAH
jgi:TRAP-type C4-dicarboxylate transport system permease small subunit